MDFLLPAIAAALGIGVMWLLYDAIHRRQEMLETVARYLDPPVRSGRDSVIGSLAGRRVKLRLTPGRQPQQVIYAEVRNPAGAFRARPRTLATKLNLRTDAPSGLEELDQAVELSRASARAIAHLAEDPDVRRTLERLVLKEGFRDLQLKEDMLVAARDPQKLEPERAVELLRLVATLAALLDRERVSIKIAGETSALPHFVCKVTGGSTAICPYCRDSLEGDVELMACPSCDTVHHRECLDEAGGCTVLGCTERPAQRA